MDLQKLIAALQAASNGATVNVTVNVTGAPVVETPQLPDTDFDIWSYAFAARYHGRIIAEKT